MYDVACSAHDVRAIEKVRPGLHPWILLLKLAHELALLDGRHRVGMGQPQDRDRRDAPRGCRSALPFQRIGALACAAVLRRARLHLDRDPGEGRVRESAGGVGEGLSTALKVSNPIFGAGGDDSDDDKDNEE